MYLSGYNWESVQPVSLKTHRREAAASNRLSGTKEVSSTEKNQKRTGIIISHTHRWKCELGDTGELRNSTCLARCGRW